MTERVHIAKADHDALDPALFPQWIETVHNDGAWFGAIVYCPECHEAGALTLHTISAAGDVNASILCHCGEWHVFGVLDGWDHGDQSSWAEYERGMKADG
jgi:hypothetical protein